MRDIVQEEFPDFYHKTKIVEVYSEGVLSLGISCEKKRKWQHISFIDGSNPYICKTKTEFIRMEEKYKLKPNGENMWTATGRIAYCIVGFEDNNKRATFYRSYVSKSGANKAIKRLMSAGNMKEIILRHEESSLLNNDRLKISSSTPIKHWKRSGNEWNLQV